MTRAVPDREKTAKVRDGQAPLPQRLAIASERDARNRLSLDASGAERDPLLDSLVAAFDGHETLKRAARAQLVDLDSQGGTFERLLKAALAAGLVVKAGHGTYSAA